MRRTLLPLSVLLTAACATLAASPFPQGTSAVFAGERANALVDQCTRISPGPVEGTWTPTDRQLAALESALPALFEAERQRQRLDARVQAADYFRQYGGLIIDGQRIIYVNGFHRLLTEGERRWDRHNPSLTWRDVAVRVCDGGPIVFGVEYNPRSGEFSNFAFNEDLARRVSP